MSRFCLIVFMASSSFCSPKCSVPDLPRTSARALTSLYLLLILFPTHNSMTVLRKYNFERPTPIQCQALPAIMSGRDVIGCAKTGSGKTLAFLLPMFRHILDQPRLQEGEGPIALLMAPTRELAMQIYNECRRFAKSVDLRVRCFLFSLYFCTAFVDMCCELV